MPTALLFIKLHLEKDLEVSAEWQILGPSVYPHWAGLLDTHFWCDRPLYGTGSALTVLHIDWGQASIGA